MKSPLITPASPLPEPDRLRKPLLPVTVTVWEERDKPAPWNLKPAYFQGSQYVKSMPPPHPSVLPLEESVKVVPPSNVVALVCVPPPFVPVTYVAKAPISNSFPLKYDTGDGGGGATTSFEETSGPANVATDCMTRAATVKATSRFIAAAYSSKSATAIVLKFNSAMDQISLRTLFWVRLRLSRRSQERLVREV